MTTRDSSTNPKSQALNPLHPYTEFDLVECFAEKCGDNFAYVASRGQWFCRSVDDSGEPYWEPDEQSKIRYWIRLFLQDLASGTLKHLCTAATVNAVEELARSHPSFAITEADLAPGELAKSDAQTAKMLECLQQDREAKQAAPRPAQSTAAAPQTPKPKPRARPPKPQPSNPAPKVDNPQTTTTPRSLIDEMARWAAIGSAA